MGLRKPFLQHMCDERAAHVMDGPRGHRFPDASSFAGGRNPPVELTLGLGPAAEARIRRAAKHMLATLSRRWQKRHGRITEWHDVEALVLGARARQLDL